MIITKRSRPVTTAVLVGLMFWLGLLLVSPFGYAQEHQHAAAQAVDPACDESTQKGKPGDYSYLHDCYHPIYERLQKWNAHGNSYTNCCSGSECRVTESVVEEIPPELKEKGYDALVLVDGRYCPIKSDVYIDLSEETRVLLKTKPHFADFFTHTHVCASKSTAGIVSGPPQIVTMPGQCPAIYCVVREVQG